MDIRIVGVFLFFLFQSFIVYAQNEISLTAIPNSPFRPTVSNPSPIGFFGDRVFSLSVALSITHFKEHARFGYQAGFIGGFVDYTYHSIVTFDNNIKFDFSDLPENFAYLGLTLKGVYRKQIRQDVELEISAGIEKRAYRYSHETDTSGYTFQSTDEKTSYKISSNRISDQFHLDFPATLSIRQVLSSRSALTTGLAFNIGFSPIRKDVLHVSKGGSEYDGSYEPTSSFIGFDLKYSYSLKKHPHRISVTRIDSTSLKKAVFFELLGAGILYSLNYDFRLRRNTNQGFGLRLGLGKGQYVSNETFGGRYTTLPINFNYIYGKGRTGLEAGISLTPEFTFRDFDNRINFHSSLNLGFRYQPLNKGIVFRLAYNPWIIGGNPGTSIGISLGYGFK